VSLKKWALTIPIEKSDAKKGLVTGWASIVTDDLGVPIIDWDGQILPINELEKAAHTAFLTSGGSGKVGDMHVKQGGGDLVGSMVFDLAKREALGFGPGQEGWAVDFLIRDRAMLAEVLDGNRAELSIKGRSSVVPLGEYLAQKGMPADRVQKAVAKRANTSKSSGEPEVLVDLELDDLELFSTVDRGASGNARHRPAIVLIKRRSSVMGLLSKWFGKDGAVKQATEEPIEVLKQAIGVLEDDAKAGVMAAYSHVVFKLEGGVQEMLETALKGVPEDKVAAIMAAFALATQVQPSAMPVASPKPEPPKPDEPKPEGEPKPDEPKPDEVVKALKDLTPEGRALFEKVLVAKQGSDDRITTLEKSVKDEVGKRVHNEAVATAKTLAGVPVETDEMTAFLADTHGTLSEKSSETLSKILTKSNALILKGGTEELGSVGSGFTSGSPWAKANEMARTEMEKIAKSGDKDERSFEQVLDDVWLANPDLQREHKEQMQPTDD